MTAWASIARLLPRSDRAAAARERAVEAPRAALPTATPPRRSSSSRAARPARSRPRSRRRSPGSRGLWRERLGESVSETRLVIRRAGGEPETKDFPAANHLGQNLDAFAAAASGAARFQSMRMASCRRRRRSRRCSVPPRRRRLAGGVTLSLQRPHAARRDGRPALRATRRLAAFRRAIAASRPRGCAPPRLEPLEESRACALRVRRAGWMSTNSACRADRRRLTTSVPPRCR